MNTSSSGFAVVVPLYNKREYIGRAVESALSQVPPPREVIVVDDGSIDGGGELVRERFPVVRVIRQENAGVSAARNVGMAAATCEWVALLDADDFWLTGHLDELARIRREHPDASMVSTRHKKMLQTSGLVAKSAALSRNVGRIRKVDYFAEASRDLTIVSSSAVALRREAALFEGGFRSEFNIGEDLEFWARMALSYPVAISDAVTSVYVRGLQSTTEVDSAKWVSPRPTSDIVELMKFAPHFAVVSAALGRSNALFTDRSLQLYLNACLVRSIKASLLRKEWWRPRALARHIRLPVMLSWAVPLCLAYMPGSLMAVLMPLRRLRAARLIGR